jgi:transcription termination factor Rho
MESGTRREELLYDKEDVPRIAELRRMLALKKPDEMMHSLIELVTRYPTNKQLLGAV